MTNSSFSPIAELDAAIQSYNPFGKAAINKAQSVWQKEFPDLPTLNAHAFQKALEVIKQVQNSQDSQDKIATLVVTGDVGSGKTQLTARLRRRVIGDGMALFVYANAAKYSDSTLVTYQFLQTLVQELARIGSEGVMQWQEVAASLANASHPQGLKIAAATIVKKFDPVYAKASRNRSNLIQNLSAPILKNQPSIDPYILRGILWTLSETYAPYAVEWLAGNELDEETAKKMGLPTNANTTTQDKEAEALDTIKKILHIVSTYKTVLIGFDELDTILVFGTGDILVQVIAQFIKKLYDNIEPSSTGQGIVILSAMFESTWQNQLLNGFGQGSGSGVIDRMSTATKAKSIPLEPLDSQSIIDLVALWLREELYEPRNLTPHDPVYPFSESELRKIGAGKLTVREALDWCAKNFQIGDKSLPPDRRFEAALEEARVFNSIIVDENLDNNVVIAEALQFGFKALIGQALKGVTSTGEQLKQVIINSVENELKPMNSYVSPKGLYNNDWINFKVSGTENNQKFTIGVAVIQQPSAASVGGGLKRLTAYKRFGLTRGCLVRSKDKKISKNSQAYQLLEKLTNQMGGEWADLKAEEILSLIDLYTVYQTCESHNLTQEQVLEFSKQQIFENPLLREILSDPSGEIDKDTIDEEINEMLLSLSKEYNMDNTLNEEDNLSELFE